MMSASWIQRAATPSTLDRSMADFEVETTGPPLSEAMAFRRSTNRCLIREEGLWQLFGGMISVQKITTKAMFPLVRLADSFLLAEVETPAMPSPTEALNACLDSFSLPASANLQMDQMRRV